MKTLSKIVLITIVVAAFSCAPQPENGSEGDTLTTDDRSTMMANGKEIAMAVGKSLVGEVQKAMSEGGVERAINYCKVNALPITDSLAAMHNVSIKRTSLKTRNPLNAPSDLEREMLNKMALMENPAPELAAVKNGGHVYFHPIPLQAFCQTCHGIPGETMQVETDSLIKVHYPEDKATGFSEGDLRGMWAIYFE